MNREHETPVAASYLDGHQVVAPILPERSGVERDEILAKEDIALTAATLQLDKDVDPLGGQFPGSIESANVDSAVSARLALLSLDSAIALSLERNPTLATVRASGPVAHTTFHVAATYPWNPQFQTQVLPYSRDRNGNDGAVSQQHVIVQTFELGRQRQFRKGAAAANWRQVSHTIRQAELTTAAQTTSLYFAVLYQRELRDMNQTLAEANEELVGVMQRRQQAGQANVADVELARLQSQSSRRQWRLAEASCQTAYMNLLSQLNLDPTTQFRLTPEWINWQWRPLDDIMSDSAGPTGSACIDKSSAWQTARGDDLALPENEALLRQIIFDRPDVAAARAGVAMARENLRLAKAMKRPDLQLGPMWQRDDAATEFWGVQGQIDIPVVNTGETLVAQRLAELRQQQIAAEQLENASRSGSTRGDLPLRACAADGRRIPRRIGTCRCGIHATV